MTHVHTNYPHDGYCNKCAKLINEANPQSVELGPLIIWISSWLMRDEPDSAPPAKNKKGINPVTVRPLPSHPGKAVTLMRMGMGIAGRHTNMFMVSVVDEAAVKGGASVNDAAVMAVVAEEKFREALGHLFPHGELSEAHVDGSDFMLKIDELASRKYLDIATKYITAADNERLQAFAAGELELPMTICQYEYGFFIGLTEALGDDMVKELGFSKALITIMRRAIAEGHGVIRIDQDGDEHAELAEFNW